MARKHHHEEHANHEAWAIPYGDLVTLLLAFFVVMYAVSSVNEGKYRVMAASMSAAFGGKPRVVAPIQVGQAEKRDSALARPKAGTAGPDLSSRGVISPMKAVRVNQIKDRPNFGVPTGNAKQYSKLKSAQQLRSLSKRMEKALSELMQRKLVIVRRSSDFIEVEIQSDVLFASGVAVPNELARDTIKHLSEILRDEPNAVRVEGYTDDRPIHTAQFNSNWELSAARSASVVHVMVSAGVTPSRLAVVGYGEQQPVADNKTEVGRNANRRVQLVILATDSFDVDSPPARAQTPSTLTLASTNSDAKKAASVFPSKAANKPKRAPTSIAALTPIADTVAGGGD